MSASSASTISISRSSLARHRGNLLDEALLRLRVEVGLLGGVGEAGEQDGGTLRERFFGHARLPLEHLGTRYRGGVFLDAPYETAPAVLPALA